MFEEMLEGYVGVSASHLQLHRRRARRPFFPCRRKKDITAAVGATIQASILLRIDRSDWETSSVLNVQFLNETVIARKYRSHI